MLGDYKEKVFEAAIERHPITDAGYILEQAAFQGHHDTRRLPIEHRTVLFPQWECCSLLIRQAANSFWGINER
jgi:hypothetical protein